VRPLAWVWEQLAEVRAQLDRELSGQQQQQQSSSALEELAELRSRLQQAEQNEQAYLIRCGTGLAPGQPV